MEVSCPTKTTACISGQSFGILLVTMPSSLLVTMVYADLDAIIRDVVASLKQFRTIATKYGVSDEWTGRVETTIIGHLKAWGEWKEDE